MNLNHGPIAGRIQRPRWTDPRLLIGVGLMAVSIIGVTSVVRSADVTEPYYVARETIAPGTPVTLDVLAVAHVRVHEGVFAQPESLEPGLIATRVIGPQELIPLDALAAPETFTARPVAIQTSIPVAASIGVGSRVDVWITTHRDDVPHSTLVASDVIVTDIERDSGAFAVGGSQTVYVNIPVVMMQDVLNALASDGEIAVLGMAGGTP